MSVCHSDIGVVDGLVRVEDSWVLYLGRRYREVGTTGSKPGDVRLVGKEVPISKQ